MNSKELRITCSTHNCEVISAEADLGRQVAMFVFLRENDHWILDEGNLYCTGGVGEHEFLYS